MKKSMLFILSIVMTGLLSSQLYARDIVQEMIDHINNSRYAIGQGQLHTDGRLYNAAFYHAKDMAERHYFSHYTPEGWSPQLRAQGWGWHSGVGEVIACGNYDPWATFQQWMNSQGHRQTLHTGWYNAIGVAHYYKAGSPCGHYWVAVVGRR